VDEICRDNCTHNWLDLKNNHGRLYINPINQKRLIAFRPHTADGGPEGSKGREDEAEDEGIECPSICREERFSQTDMGTA
jgi:hypothetical protein